MNKKVNIKSTAIKSIEYNDIRQDLKVSFVSGKVYVYTPVSEEFFDKLNKSTSKGTFFNLNIKNNNALTVLKMIK